MSLVVHKLYRLSRTMDEPNLRGRVVVFKGWAKQPWDIMRAVVEFIDGSEEWHVNPHFVLPF